MTSHDSAPSIDGFVAGGFGPVADAFRANFREHGEVGAAVAVYVDGEPAVDLWAGMADPRTGRAWTATTPAIVFSCSKGILAICAYLLVQESRLDLDAPVADYWPEFGQAGKEEIPVRWLLTHQAGLPSLDRDLERKHVLTWEPVVHALEEQAPLWPPGTAHAYHAHTFGWLVGEVLRRVSGQGVGAFVRRRLAEPLGLRLWIGLPADRRDEIAYLLPPLPDTDPETASAIGEALASPAAQRSFTMSGAFAFPHDERGYVTFNDADIQVAELPAANGIADARSLGAPLCGLCRHGGRSTAADLGLGQGTRSSRASRGPQWFGAPDLGERWGGYRASLLSPRRPTRRFSVPAASVILVRVASWPLPTQTHRIGFALRQQPDGGLPWNPRARRLVEALKGCLGG